MDSWCASTAASATEQEPCKSYCPDLAVAPAWVAQLVRSYFSYRKDSIALSLHKIHNPHLDNIPRPVVADVVFVSYLGFAEEMAVDSD